MSVPSMSAVATRIDAVSMVSSAFVRLATCSAASAAGRPDPHAADPDDDRGHGVRHAAARARAQLGGELQAPMGRAIIGGLVTSTLLTLVVVPVLYSLLVREKGAAPAAAPLDDERGLPVK
jgi:multidrug efflux pump subunit AcrB